MKKNLSNYLLPLGLILYVAATTSSYTPIGYSDLLSIFSSAFLVAAIVMKIYEYMSKKSDSKEDKIGNFSLIAIVIIFLGFVVYGFISPYLIGWGLGKR